MQGKVRRGGEKTETTCRQSYSRTRTRTHAHAHTHMHTCLQLHLLLFPLPPHAHTSPPPSFSSSCWLPAASSRSEAQCAHAVAPLSPAPHDPASSGCTQKVGAQQHLPSSFSCDIHSFTRTHTHTHSHSRAHSHTCDRVPPLLFFSDVSDSQTQSSDASASASGVRVVGGGAGDGGGSDGNTTAASRADDAQQRRQQEQVQEIVRELAQMRVSRQLLDAWKQADTKVQRLHQHPHRPLTHALFVSGALLSLLLCFC